MGKDKIYLKPNGSSSYAVINKEDYYSALTTPGAVAHGVANILGKQYQAGSILVQIDGSEPIETRTTSDVADVYEVALVGVGTVGSPTPPLRKWDSVTITPSKANTGAATLTVSDWTTTAAIKRNGEDLEPNELVVGFEYRLVWTGTVWELGLIDESLEIRNKGGIDASANPLIPAGKAGDQYYIEAAGKIGGGAGIEVAIGDVVIYRQDTAGGTAAAVGNAIAVETFGAAEAAATAAAASATAAASSAAAAQTAKTAAEDAEDAAAAAATAAAGSASTASTHASNAYTSATTVQTAKTAAEAAQAAAETWRNQAEGYKNDAAAHETGASAANTDAQTAKAAAQGYANNALSDKNDAQVAKDQAQSAANDAAGSANNANTYRLAALAAQVAAEAAQATAQAHESNAANYSNAAGGYVINANNAAAAAEAARDAAIAAGGEIRRRRISYADYFGNGGASWGVSIDNNIPPGAFIEFLQVKMNESFAGGSISDIAVGFYTHAVTTTPVDVMQATGAEAGQVLSISSIVPNTIADTTTDSFVGMSVSVTGGVGTDITQGSFDVWYRVTQLPIVAFP